MDPAATPAPRLLVVDDEPDILFAIREFFTDRGYEVDCADDREGAEELVARRTYALMLVDLQLSGRPEGLDLVAFARQESPGTRIVVLTAYGSPEIEAVARGLGADAFLAKPLPLPDLARITSGLLSR